jgi:hypothetical protein
MFRTSTYVVITLPTTVAIVWSRPTACVNPASWLAAEPAGTVTSAPARTSGT